MSEFKLTSEQEVFRDCTRNGDSFLCDSLAGVGKSATAIYSIKETKKKGYIIVYNKKNADETKTKIPFTSGAGTWHSTLNEARRKLFPNAKIDAYKKMENIILKLEPSLDYRNRFGIDKAKAYEDFEAVKSLATLVKNSKLVYTLTDVATIADFYGITSNLTQENLINLAAKAVEISDEMVDSFDFDDMIRHPLLYDGIKSFGYDVLFCDECQDNTPLRTLAMQAYRDLGVQVAAMGDQQQSIYVFGGADPNSIKTITEMLGKVIRLTTNFRCSKEVIRNAQTLCPDIKYFEDSPEGYVKYSEPGKLSELMQPGDCALSRLNRVIVPAAFRLIREGKKATIVGGKDLGGQLIRMIDSFKASSIHDLLDKAETWQDNQLAKTKSENGKLIIVDKYETITEIASVSKTIDEMKTWILNVFKEDETEGYLFSTGHKAKGLEWPNVFILDSDRFRMNRKGMKPWEYEQESNLYYVACTRAKVGLTFVRSAETQSKPEYREAPEEDE